MFFDQISDVTHKRALAYYRHSAEDKQENSVAIQRDHAFKFAAEHGIEIIHEIADEGKSGLLADRPGFNSLFSDWIGNPNAPVFDYVLVYDPSRWGRFEDKNEAGHYEFLCKEDGKTVVYVSIGFPRGEDDELGFSMRITMERQMAFIHSKNLSSKVFFGSVKVVQQGYSAGGTACYGMARLLLDENKKPIGLLKKGQHKVIANQRVSFVPAMDETTEIVKRIFRDFVDLWKTPVEIAASLNAEDIKSPGGSLWNGGSVVRILTNEVYTGSLTYNKRSNKLKRGIVINDRSKWVISRGSFEPVISEELFNTAQERLYWFNSSAWMRGRKLINKMRHRAVIDLEKMLYDEQCFVAYDLLRVKRFPIIFGVTCYDKNQKPYWCFKVNDTCLTFPNIIYIATDLFVSNSNKRVFIVPREHVRDGICLITAESDLFEMTNVPASEVRERLLAVARKID